LGIGDWGLGPIPNPQTPIPNPQNNIFFIQILLNNNNYINKLIIKLINFKLFSHITKSESLTKYFFSFKFNKINSNKKTQSFIFFLNVF